MITVEDILELSINNRIVVYDAAIDDFLEQGQTMDYSELNELDLLCRIIRRRMKK